MKGYANHKFQKVTSIYSSGGPHALDVQFEDGSTFELLFDSHEDLRRFKAVVDSIHSLKVEEPETNFVKGSATGPGTKVD